MRLTKKTLAFFFTTDRMPQNLRSDALLRTPVRWLLRSILPLRFSVKKILDRQGMNRFRRSALSRENQLKKNEIFDNMSS